MADFRARIQAELDLANAQSILNNFLNQRRQIRLNVELNDSGRSILNQLSHLQSQMSGAGRQAGDNFAQGFASALGTINTRNAENTIARMQRSLAGFKLDRSQITAVTQDIESMNLQLKNITTRVNRQGNIDLRITGVEQLGNGIERVVTQFGTFNRETNQLVKHGKTISQTFQGMANATKIATQGNKFDTWIDKNVSHLGQYTQQLGDLRNRMLDMNANGATKGTFEAWKNDFKNLQSLVEKTKASASKIMSGQDLTIKGNQFTTWVNTNKDSLAGFENRVESLRQRMENMQNVGTTKGGFTNWLKDFNVLKSEVEKTKSSMTQMMSAQDMKIQGNGFTSWINTNKDSLVGFEKEIQSLTERMNNMQKNGASVSDWKKWANDVKEFKSEVKLASSSMVTMANATKMQISNNNLSSWLNNNSKALRAYGKEFKQLQVEMQGMIQNGATEKQFQSWNQRVALLQSQARATGNVGKTFGEQFKYALTSVTQFAASYVSLYRVFATIKEGIQTIVEMDDALVDLQKTSTATPKQLSEFYERANEEAKAFGTTTTQIIQGAADWSRLGYNLEDAQKMSKLSAQFAAISPGMSVEESTEGLVSTMKAFGIEANDVLDGVMSKINKTGNSFALSNNDIVTALENSSSAMAAANNSLDETIALITAGTEIVQDASKVGGLNAQTYSNVWRNLVA